MRNHEPNVIKKIEPASFRIDLREMAKDFDFPGISTPTSEVINDPRDEQKART